MLAALHFNENSGREQLTNKAGEAVHTLQFPKAKCGGYTVRKVAKACTYGK